MTDQGHDAPLDDELFALLASYDDQLVEGDGAGDTGDHVSDELRPRWQRARSLVDRLARVGRFARSGNCDSTADGQSTHDSLHDDAPSARHTFHRPQGSESNPAAWKTIPRAPEQIARFKVVEEIGCGGFGIVMRAFDPTLQRDVALKIPRLGALANDELRNRFVREVRAAAALDHPNIVPVFEAGEDNSICYIASAYCGGPNLAAWLRQREELVPIQLAAWLVSVLAQAVQHAHSRGVLHRDLKPSNVLLEPLEGNEASWLDTKDRKPDSKTARHAVSQATDFPFVPRITDFGLAKVSSSGLEETKSTMLLGTLSYMSPEQAAGHGRRVGPQSDVYSLGVILYQLLIGRPPLVAEGELETLARVQKDDPVPPRRLRPGIPRDLETICLTCLEKEPERRYTTASLLSDDLQRFLRSEPIHARPTPAPARVWRWCRRRPLAATLVGLLALLTIAGPLVATNQARLYRKQSLLYAAAETAREETNRLLYTSDMNLALQAWEDGNVGRVQELLDRHGRTAGQQDYRGFEWHYLRRQYQESQAATIQEGLPVYCLDVSPDGRLLAVGGADHLVNLYDVSSRRKIGELPGHTAQVISLAFSPDGALIASASWDRTIRLWDATSQRELPPLERDPLGVWCVAFSPDGNILAAANYDGSIALWDLESRKSSQCSYQHDGEVSCVAFSPDGRLLASCDTDGVVKLLDMDHGEVHQHRQRGVWSLTFSPRGETLALASDHLIKVLDRKGNEVSTLRGHRVSNSSVAFSPDGKRLASSGQDNMVRLLNAEEGESLAALKGHFGPVKAVTFSADGRQLFSGGLDGRVKAWDVVSDGVQDVLHHPGGVHAVAFSPGGHMLATTCSDGQIRLWDVQTGRFQYALKGHTRAVVRARFFTHLSQTILASASDDGTVKLWDTTSRRELHSLASFRTGTKCLAVGNMSATLAWSRPDDTLAVWSFAPAEVVASFERGYVHALDLSPDGQVLAAACSDRTVRVWDASSQTLLNTLTAHTTLVHCLKFSSDGGLLATGGTDRTLKLWRTQSLRETRDPMALRTFTAHGGTVANAAFSPDGTTLASGSDDRTVRLWDLKTGQQRGVFDAGGVVVDLAFSPDGNTLAAASWNGTARLWRAETE